MKLLHIHPSDSAWLRRWLRSNVSFFCVAAALLIAARYQPAMPRAPRASAADEGFRHDATEPPSNDEFRPDGRPSAVAPEGWRRTVDGWEHVSSWTSIKSINRLIAEQQALEPRWVRVSFARLRRISPLMVALLQITAIAAIMNVAKSRTASGNKDRSGESSQ
jgi:hypothetical protein